MAAASNGDGTATLVESAHKAAVTMLHGEGVAVAKLTTHGQMLVPIRLQLRREEGILAFIWSNEATRAVEALPGQGQHHVSVPLHTLTHVSADHTDDQDATAEPIFLDFSSSFDTVSPPQGLHLRLNWPNLRLLVRAASVKERNYLALCFLLLRNDLIESGAVPSPSATSVQEQGLMLAQALDVARDDEFDHRWRVGFVRLSRAVHACRVDAYGVAWQRWTSLVRTANQGKMTVDRKQWLLHANARSKEDLQAWYHSMFSDELYRLKGPFWYKEAALQDYVHHPFLQAKPEDTPSSVLCTSDMTYATMAATMYTIRMCLQPAEYSLFELLTSEGVMVLKHPRTGRPQKKLFQLSLVQGEMYLFMYLTWKGRHGTQGVELASVEQLLCGRSTDVLRRSGKAARDDCYLSLVLPDRSLDLCFEGSAERGVFAACIRRLITMERSILSRGPLNQEKLNATTAVAGTEAAASTANPTPGGSLSPRPLSR